MGWLFPYEAKTKEILIEVILNRNNTVFKDKDGNDVKLSVLKHTIRNNNFWIVLKIEKDGKAPIQTIVLYMLSYDRDARIWGYKDIDACCGPYASDCPVKYLDMVTEDCKKGNDYQAFEKRVRAVAKERNEQNALKRNFILNHGDIVLFNAPLTAKNGVEIHAIKITYNNKSCYAGNGITIVNGEKVNVGGIFKLPNLKYVKEVERGTENHDVV